MFDKLFGMMNKIEPEAPAESKGSATPTAQSNMKAGSKLGNTPDGQSVNIGYDYLKRKDGMDEIGKAERIQQKMELLQRLQKELGQRG
jgi:hypothetical protein